MTQSVVDQRRKKGGGTQFGDLQLAQCSSAIFIYGQGHRKGSEEEEIFWREKKIKGISEENEGPKRRKK